MRVKPLPFLTLAVLSLGAAPQSGKPVGLPSEGEIAKIEAAMSARPAAAPKKPRKLLVLGHNAYHDPVPYAALALEIMARKTGAFEVVVTDDGSYLEPDKLVEFDALFANNWHGFDPFLGVSRREFGRLPAERKEDLKKQQARRRKSLLDFVRGGKGLAGVHASTVGLNDWKEWAEMIGGRYAALPWMEADVRIVDPGHPVNAAFEGEGFVIQDEIYELRAPYSRDRVRLLLAVDWERMSHIPKATRYGKPARTDGDYGLSWVKRYGEGRVFYCALGHFTETYWNPKFLRHILDGIRFALGDLGADASPRK